MILCYLCIFHLSIFKLYQNKNVGELEMDRKRETAQKRKITDEIELCVFKVNSKCVWHLRNLDGERDVFIIRFCIRTTVKNQN